MMVPYTPPFFLNSISSLENNNKNKDLFVKWLPFDYWYSLPVSFAKDRKTNLDLDKFEICPVNHLLLMLSNIKKYIPFIEYFLIFLELLFDHKSIM